MIRFKHLNIFLIFSLLILFGTFGYHYLEHWSYHDSLYMTIVTLSTAGFQEIHPLSENGRNLTMLLLFVGLMTVAYSLSFIVHDIWAMNIEVRRKIKMESKIAKLKNHIILCGYGRMGKVIAEELYKHKRDFLIIEKDELKIKALEASPYNYLHGDSTHDEVLMQAKISEAKTLVSMIDSDADALYLALAARTLKNSLKIIVRASEEEARPKILRAGADRVILPILMSGTKVAQVILNPAIEETLDLSALNGLVQDQVFQLADVIIGVNSPHRGKALNRCFPHHKEVIVVGIKKSNSEFLFSPSIEYKIENGDVLLILAKAETISTIV